MEKALQRYLRHHRAEGSSPKTVTYHQDSIGLLIRFLRGRGHSCGIDDLHADDVRAWLEDQQGRGLAQKTIKTRVISVKAWTRWLVEEEWLDRDPLRKLKPPKVDDTPKDTLGPEEIDRLLGTCDRRTATGARDFAIMLLLFSTGLRAAEMTGLREDDIAWDKGLIVVQRGKGGKGRVVPLGPKVECALDRYLHHPKRRGACGGAVFVTDEGAPLTYWALRKLLNRHGDRAGIRANAHKWRHSAAVQYLRGGGRVEVLKTMLGHSTLDMTLHYARIAGVDLTAAHETADPVRALKTRV